MERTDIASSCRAVTVVAFVIGCVAVIEAVCQHEIHVGVLPCEVFLTYRLRRLEFDGVRFGRGPVLYGIGYHIFASLQTAERVVGI